MRQLGAVRALNGVRGLAVLLVIGRHYNNRLPGGGLGVDLFFVLSGFLITALLLGERARTGRVSLAAFYWRRALRLLPALLGLLAVYMLFVVGTGHFGHDEHAYRNALLGLLYVSNIPLAAGSDNGSLSHLWSLAQEEQFYLLWPPVLALLLARRAHATRLALALLGVAAAFAAHRWLIASTASSRRLWVAPDMHADALLIGCAAAFIYAFGLWRSGLQIAAWFGVGAAGFVVATESREDRGLFGWPLLVYIIGCAVVVLAVADRREGILARLLSFPPLCWIGVISYGLYLWHFPIFMALGANWVTLTLAFIAATISYRYIETPFLRLKTRFPLGPRHIADAPPATATAAAVAAPAPGA